MRVVLLMLVSGGAIAQGPWCPGWRVSHRRVLYTEWSRPALLVQGWSDIQTQWTDSVLNSILNPDASTFDRLSYVSVRPIKSDPNDWSEIHERSNSHKERVKSPKDVRLMHQTLTGRCARNSTGVLQVYPVSNISTGLHMHSSFRDKCGREVRDIHVFVASPNAISFNWHTDKVDAMLCMISGSKHVRVAGQTPYSDVQIDSIINPGDCVYFPAYFYHNLISVTPSVLVSIGLSVRSRPWWNHVLTQKPQLPAFTPDMRGILVFTRLRTEFIREIIFPSESDWTRLSYNRLEHNPCHGNASRSSHSSQPFGDDSYDMFEEYMNGDGVRLLQVNHVEDLSAYIRRVFYGPVGLNSTFSRSMKEFSVIYVGRPKNTGGSFCQAWRTSHDTMLMTLYGTGEVSIISKRRSDHACEMKRTEAHGTEKHSISVGGVVYLPAGTMWNLRPRTRGVVFLRVQFTGPNDPT